jgi:hypothetical protein
MAHDALVLVDMSREDMENWLADAQADFDAAVARFADRCRELREQHGALQAKQRAVAADADVKAALAAPTAGGKTTYRLGSTGDYHAAIKKLGHEESMLQMLQARK